MRKAGVRSQKKSRFANKLFMVFILTPAFKNYLPFFLLAGGAASSVSVVAMSPRFSLS